MRCLRVVLRMIIILLCLYILIMIAGIFSKAVNRQYIKNEVISNVSKTVYKLIYNEITVYGNEFTTKRIVSKEDLNSYGLDSNYLDNKIYNVLRNNLNTCAIDFNMEQKKIVSEADTIADEGFDEYIETINNGKDSDIIRENINIVNQLKTQKNVKFLLNKFYIVDSATSTTDDIIDINNMLNSDMTINQDNSKPQILIYHTHASESYADSREGYVEDTIVGVGEELTSILENRYGYNVIHDTSSYDVINGKWNRQAYDTALPSIQKILKDNPTIEVTIDLHRNSGNKKEVTQIAGKNVAQVMFFNGLSRSCTESRESIINPNLKDNLAFSLQLKIASMSNYESFAKKIYLKGYRYNLHLMKKATLIEVGNDKNTVEEAKNAMNPLAKVINEVIN